MPAPIPTNERESFFDYQFHQVAMYTKDPQKAMGYWRSRGHLDWIGDQATLRGYITNPLTGIVYQSSVQAEMWFNYTVQPMELEFLTYHMGTSRHSLAGNDRPSAPFISHMSVYVDDVMGEIREHELAFGYLPYHRFVTTDHTNLGVRNKKRFIEAIYDTKGFLGYDVKMIQKVPWDYDDDIYLRAEMFDDWKSLESQRPDWSEA